MRIRRDVEVLGLDAEQQIANRTADKERLKTGVGQPVQHSEGIFGDSRSRHVVIRSRNYPGGSVRLGRGWAQVVEYPVELCSKPPYNTSPRRAAPGGAIRLRSLRLAVRTSPSHGENRGSIPLGSTNCRMTDAAWKSGGPLRKVLNLPAQERVAFGWSFACFFSILCAYFLLRPIRDEMAILAGPENIPDLWLGTFVAVLLIIPVFGWITKRFSRQQFMPAFFVFFSANLLGFFWVFGNDAIDKVWAARAFFVWLSVFNMFVVSLFWSFMADVYDKDQARRLFGMIAAGGSAGAICGPVITATLVGQLGIRSLMVIAALLLLATVFTVFKLLRWARTNAKAGQPVNDDQPIGGGVLEGIWLVLKTPYLLGIATLILLGTFPGTAMYLYQAEMLSEHIPDSESRTQLLASMDAAINVLTLILQFAVARYVINRFGVGLTLLLLPLLSIVSLLAIAAAPSVALLVMVQVLRRATSFGLNNPAKETLFSVVDRHSKYKAKNLIDVTLVRTSDVLSSQTVRLLQSLGLTFTPIVLICAALSAVWAGVAIGVGRNYRRLYRSAAADKSGGDMKSQYSAQTTRRRIVKGLLAASYNAAVAAGASVAASAINTRPIPSSGEALPVVGLGTWQVFDVSADDALLDDAQRNHFDHARARRDRHRFVADVRQSRGHRRRHRQPAPGRLDRCFWRPRCGPKDETRGLPKCSRSFERMRSDRIDLMQVHNLLDLVDATAAPIRRWQEQGKIRYTGITHYRVDAHPSGHGDHAFGTPGLRADQLLHRHARRRRPPAAVGG